MISRSCGDISDIGLGGGDGLSPSKSETACWTCRRRRVQCDKALPTCQKCHKAGKECLGYKKPLVWNNGVASRGKMMGKTFQKPESVLDSIIATAKTEPNLDISAIPTPTSSPSSSVLEEEESEVEEISREVSISRSSSPFSNLVGVLVDPIFQDLKPITRYYLDYFAQKLCIEAVLHDLPGQNPFRGLMAAARSSPLLMKSMLALAARHITNYTNYSTSSTWSSLIPETSNQKALISNSSRYHAYYYKQIALAQLREDLESSTSSGIENDIIVASISLFIWIDVLEAGKNTWRIHLEGMKKLVGLKESPPSLPSSPSSMGVTPRSEGYSSASSITAHPYFFDICITFDIMGTTLSRPYKISKPLSPTLTVQMSLLRSEKISFIGCPAELLWLILVINWKCSRRTSSSSSASTTTDSSPSSTHFTHPEQENEEEHTNTSILTQILEFDPFVWARSTTMCIPEADTQERIHLAYAYQFAVLIYYHRVLSSSLLVGTVPYSMVDLADSVLTHLSTLPRTHPFIKSIVWPTFIAGAEVTRPEQRDQARHLLHTFWIGYRSVNVVHAAGILEEMWKRCDALSDERREQLEGEGFWSKGVLNFGEEVDGDGDGQGGGRRRRDWFVGGDVDWLFV